MPHTNRDLSIPADEFQGEEWTEIPNQDWSAPEPDEDPRIGYDPPVDEDWLDYLYDKAFDAWMEDR
jgi:hypothetical protein